MLLAVALLLLCLLLRGLLFLTIFDFVLTLAEVELDALSLFALLIAPGGFLLCACHLFASANLPLVHARVLMSTERRVVRVVELILLLLLLVLLLLVLLLLLLLLRLHVLDVWRWSGRLCIWVPL